MASTIKFKAGVGIYVDSIETQGITTKGKDSTGVDIVNTGDITIYGGKFTGPITYYDKDLKAQPVGLKIVRLSASEYEELETKEANTLYLCTTEE